MNEVKEAIFSVKDETSSGPDGLNTKFFKVRWNKVKEDLLDAFNDLFNNGKIIKECSHTFIHMIPKSRNASKISQGT